MPMSVAAVCVLWTWRKGADVYFRENFVFVILEGWQVSTDFSLLSTGISKDF